MGVSMYSEQISGTAGSNGSPKWKKFP